MKVLLTGASSFTGYWFAKALSEAGHDVVAPLRGDRNSYMEGVRAERVRLLGQVSNVVYQAPFGSVEFLELARAECFDLLAHHAARVGDYRSVDFDVAEALSQNTRNLREALSCMAETGLRGCIITGSVFESGEGCGEPPLRAFSQYGLSKAFSSEICAFHCREISIPFGKFVIPNPFGPLEEPRFCAYLVRTWRESRVATVRTPEYVRDNIHVWLLALAYRRFCEEVVAQQLPALKLNPSGYVESQGAFALRFADAMKSRLGLDCAVELASQSDFGEPMMRSNYQSAAHYVGGWDESEGWNAIAEFYLSRS